ncbi:MAG: MHYT domain-containing protein [Allorhizobium sp.]
MFAGHDSYLVALSLTVAVLGGYTGFGLAASIRLSPGVPRRLLLAGAAAFLSLGIWTMHFVGMLAAPMPPDAAYLVLPTIVSFLICALVVGISLYFVSIGEPSQLRIAASAVLLGAGIVSMHYVGVHALSGPYHIVHRPMMVMLSALIAILAAYGGLRIYLARQGGMRLALSASAFGIAVSGMHYTAMYGMHLEVMPAAMAMGDGLVASAQVLSLIVALLCFVIAAGFLLFLVPEPRGPRNSMAGRLDVIQGDAPASGMFNWGSTDFEANAANEGTTEPRSQAQPHGPALTRIPVESADGTHLIEISDIRSIRADAHYTLIHDGQRERMCSWSISQAEAKLDPALFARVHRSHIIALPHVTFLRREGDGAIVELDGPVAHMVPVSRSKIAEVKARLGVARYSSARQ